MNRGRGSRRDLVSVGSDAEALLNAAAARIAASPAIDVWQRWQPRSDAEIMLGAVLGEEVVAATLERTLSAAVQRRFAACVDRRVAGEPVALVVGFIDFCGVRIATRRGVFVPRLSTEFAAETAVRRLRGRRNPIAVDVATGSGPLALTMAARVPGAEVYGLDIAADAVALGRHNARRLGLDNVSFKKSDMFAALPRRLRGHVALITIHPPYVASHELATLPEEIRAFEPTHTLSDSSDDGLRLVRAVAAAASEWLAPRGCLIIEIGPHLSRRAQAVLRHAGLRDVVITRDRVGVTRVIVARR